MKIKEYLGEANEVMGWVEPEVWHCIEAIHEFQKERNINGPICEIGVYHGKFFCGLALTKGADLDHCAIDVFDMQEYNLDGAGEGDLEIFKGHLMRTGIHNCEIHKKDSLTLDDAFINKRLNKYSLFSVDACHLVKHTINDFQIAMKLVQKEGIIFIDDYYNPNWPGVQEGICKYYQNQDSSFVPVLYSSNKLFVCHINYHMLYYDYVQSFISKQYPSSRIKKVKRFGYDSLTVTPEVNSE